MKNMKYKWLLALLIISSFTGTAQARFALDTVGVSPNSSSLTFDSNDFVAAEFSLGAGEVITDLQAYINGGDTGTTGDQFSFNLYAVDGSAGLGTLQSTFNATYQADGWNGLSNLSYSVSTTGNYWLTLETVSSNLLLPGFSSAGTAAPITYAFSSNGGSSFTAAAIPSFGLQVTAVPLPAAAWLFGTGLFSLAFRARRKV